MLIACKKLIFATRPKISSNINKNKYILSRFYNDENTSSNNNNDNNIKVNDSFSPEEENLVVNIINNCTADDLEKYSINKNQIKKLLAHRNENGKFKVFDDLLTVQSIPSLIKLSKSIIDGGKKSKNNTSTSTSTSTSINKNIVTPSIDSLEKFAKSLGLHILGDTISWTALDIDGNLKNWQSHSFENQSKTNLVPLVNSIIEIALKIPDADAYIMEADSYTSLGKLKSSAYYYHLQRQQVIATIISVLCMRRQYKYNMNDVSVSSDDKLKSSMLHNFYTMQPRSPARLFNLIVGSEVVSNESIISDILLGKKIENLSALPSVNVDSTIMFNYRKSDQATRNLMNTSLLLTLSFIHLLRTNISK
ncbi:hypothetical protein HCN44_008888 [Aphidius gifuensis]|uniref:Transcription elongation factor, mitochondrial n=1 Tax=Aphidius gifuensis TaxID=684658 RepID=A0A835CPR1_APHGI|nr:hypothetical protein HCN44_008888 [Aphidius gifuensis]